MGDLRARVVRVAVSFVLVGFSVALLIRAGLGVSPFDVLNTGVAHLFDIPVGVAFLLVALVTTTIGASLGGRLGWATVIGELAIAPLLQLSLAVIPEPQRLLVRVPMFAIGVLILTFAVCLAVTSELGPGPGEVMMLGLIARGRAVVTARWVVDGGALVLGTLLSGAVGVGTVVFALGFGPLVARCLRLMGYDPPVRLTEAVVAD